VTQLRDNETGAGDARTRRGDAEVVLELADLAMHFGPVRAVDGVSLRIRRGQVTALVGESGSGKSTVGRCIVRLVEPTGGTVRLAGTDITHLSRSEMRAHRRDVSIVFQDPAGSLDPRMLVGDIVAEPLQLQGVRLSRKERAERVSDGLRRVGLRPEVAKRYPHELSGGQRQRVSIARALMSEPTLLVADEPTSALDVSVQAAVLNLLADLQRDIGFACLFITHDLSAVEYLADDIAVMYLGQLVEQGSREEIFARPRHPYTQALLAAAPVADPGRQRSRTRVLLGDDLPSAMDPPSGCRFHTRCPIAVARCAEEVPALRRSGGASVACHFVHEDGSAPDIRQDQPATTTGTPA
jgi:peptide/nickel transport system ATP-binding protein